MSNGALGRTWRQSRRAAYQGELSHARLFTLVQLAVGQQRLQLLHHWLPLILRQAVFEGERNGSAVALADWLQQQGAIELAALCLEQVHWPAMDGPAWLLRGVIEQRRGGPGTG